MARRPNELSATQRNAKAYNGIKAQIKRFGIDYLASLGDVSRTTIFLYQRGRAIHPNKEKELKRTIQVAVAAKKKADVVEVAESIELARV